ncbi:MAG: hypothetical protein ACE5R6_07430 [Candidatus Heimdallarchaeota archaeon]
MAALLHDLVDTALHPSKLGRTITIPDPYVQWLYEHHHSKVHPTYPKLKLLQEANSRTSRYARLLSLPTRRRKVAPINIDQLIQHLEQAAHRSVYQLYSLIYHSQELNSFTASKAQPIETLRNRLVGVANWALFLLRTSTSTSLPASAPLAG